MCDIREIQFYLTNVAHIIFHATMTHLSIYPGSRLNVHIHQIHIGMQRSRQYGLHSSPHTEACQFLIPIPVPARPHITPYAVQYMRDNHHCRRAENDLPTPPRRHRRAAHRRRRVVRSPRTSTSAVPSALLPTPLSATQPKRASSSSEADQMRHCRVRMSVIT